jgi:hypothetical protein
MPTSVYDRYWRVLSFAELGRFPEAAPHLLRGNWAKACSLIERWTALNRMANIVLQLPLSVASSAWVLA